MKLAVATKPHFFIEEDKIITRLFEEGLDYLFLRKTHPHPQYIERLLNLIPGKYHKKIFVCNYPRFSQEYKFAGQLINIDEETPCLPPIKGKSVSNSNNLQQLNELKEKYDIVYFGPLGRTFYQSAELNEYGKKVINKKVWAYGELDEKNLKKLSQYKFGGVILDKILWDKFDACRSTDYDELINYFHKLQKIINKI
jgi:thiamine-phosphate pyrophosphorylase